MSRCCLVSFERKHISTVCDLTNPHCFRWSPSLAEQRRLWRLHPTVWHRYWISDFSKLSWEQWWSKWVLLAHRVTHEHDANSHIQWCWPTWKSNLCLWRFFNGECLGRVSYSAQILGCSTIESNMVYTVDCTMNRNVSWHHRETEWWFATWREDIPVKEGSIYPFQVPYQSNYCYSNHLMNYIFSNNFLAFMWWWAATDGRWQIRNILPTVPMSFTQGSQMFMDYSAHQKKRIHIISPPWNHNTIQKRCLPAFLQRR